MTCKFPCNLSLRSSSVSPKYCAIFLVTLETNGHQMSCTLPICMLCFTKPYMHIKLKLICELSVFNPYQIGNGFKRNQPFLNMYFIVLNTNTESVSSEYTPDTKNQTLPFTINVQFAHVIRKTNKDIQCSNLQHDTAR